MHAQPTPADRLTASARRENAASEPRPEPMPVRGGMVTLRGYGLRLTVDGGRLVANDGTGQERRNLRLSRYRAAQLHLARVTIIGHTGSVSLDALRWLRAVGASLAIIDADGCLLAIAAPTDDGDAALRRALALAPATWAGVEITGALLDRKLAGQRSVLAALGIAGSTAAAFVSDHEERMSAAVSDPQTDPLGPAATLATMRLIEAGAAEIYWSALAAVSIPFVRHASGSIPEHWRVIGPRHSPLSGSPRHALTPAHATLNYLYAVAETEVTVALMSAGLDPAMGILHTDSGARASLALDILDAIRPEVDRYAIALLRDRPLSLHDCGELPSGVCRLRSNFAALLCDTAPRWRTLAVEAVEMLTGLLTTLAAEIIPGAPTDGRVSRSPRSHGARVIAVPGSSGRILRGRLSIAPVRPPGRCRDCGGAVTGDRVRCDRCAARWLVDEAKRLASAGPARLAQLRSTGHDPAHGGNVEIERRATQLAHRAADAAWERRYGSDG